MDKILSSDGLLKYSKAINDVDKRFNRIVKEYSKDHPVETVGTELQKIRMSIYRYINYLLPRFMQLSYSSDSQVITKLQSLKRDYAKTNQIEKVASNLLKLSILFGILYYISNNMVQDIYINKVKKSFRALMDLVDKSVKNIIDMNMEKLGNSFLDKGNVLLKSIMDIVKLKGTDSYIDKGLLVALYIISALMLTELFLMIKITLMRATGKI